MKYFFISMEPAYIDAPKVVNWYNKINPKWINVDNEYRLPKRELLFINKQSKIVYTDILTTPFLLMSSMVRDVALLYDPCIIMKEVVLLDAEHQKSTLYFLPILEEVICEEQSLEEFPVDDKRNICLDFQKVKHKAIFMMKTKRSKYVVGNLDFIESILKRGAIGIALQEVKYIKQ